MTHGDQAKAKTAKSSQASATPKTSSKTGGKAVESSKAGKTSGKEAGEGGKAGQLSVKKAGAEKGSVAAAPKAVSGAKEAGGSSGKGAKARSVADDAAPGFSNAAVAAAFKRALKKYPNAFRKLTD